MSLMSLLVVYMRRVVCAPSVTNVLVAFAKTSMESKSIHFDVVYFGRSFFILWPLGVFDPPFRRIFAHVCPRPNEILFLVNYGEDNHSYHNVPCTISTC